MRLAPALLGAVALAGCGGGDDRLTREEFVAQATAVCDRFDEEIEALGEPESLDGVETLGRELREILQEGIAELRGLEPPAELEEPFGRYLASADDVVVQLDRLVEGAAAGDQAAVARAAAEGEAISERSQALAAAAGVPGCEDE